VKEDSERVIVTLPVLEVHSMLIAENAPM